MVTSLVFNESSMDIESTRAGVRSPSNANPKLVSSCSTCFGLFLQFKRHSRLYMPRTVDEVSLFFFKKCIKSGKGMSSIKLFCTSWGRHVAIAFQ